MSTPRPVVLVTGGSRGIGAAVALLAARRGYDVAVGYRSEREAAERIVAGCREGGAQALAVWSRHLVERIEGEPFGLNCPPFADELVGRETSQALEPSTEVVGIHEIVEVTPELVMAVVVVTSDGSFLDRPVHPFDLAVGPGMVDPGAAVLDAILATPHGEHVRDDACGRSIGMARRQPKLDAIISENRVDLVGHGCNQGDQKGRCRHAACLFDQLGEGELGGAIDRDEEVKLALGRSNFCDVYVEVADRVAFELAAARLGAVVDLRQAADPVTLKAAVQS